MRTSKPFVEWTGGHRFYRHCNTQSQHSSNFQSKSEVVGEYCKPGGPAFALELTKGELAPFGGGIPLKAANSHVSGALGVSRASVEQDAEVANAALASLETHTRKL